MVFFCAAGLPFEKVVEGLTQIKSFLDPLGLAWGTNLIHSPNEPILEKRVAQLYIKQGVRCVSDSSYMQLSAPLVKYAILGLKKDNLGHIQRANYLFAKISRPETAA